MSNIVILGAQWGDESKGKLTDVFAEHADVVARYQGGDNAGTYHCTRRQNLHSTSDSIWYSQT